MRVLIVDDAPQVRQDLHLLLDLSGEVEVVGEAADGREALSLTEALQPDAVLMDLEMPRMDGYEATRTIKVRWPDCRVIAFSVHAYPEARQRAARAGLDDFVEKGASLCQILWALSRPDH
jgi:DNA-binding NarL/FixJ family response regulator